MHLYRLCKKKYALNFEDNFSGIGAFDHGGRWNSRGHYVVYCSESLSLAVLEILAHADLEDLPDDLVCTSVEIPEQVSKMVLLPTDLPNNWRDYDPSPEELKLIGNKWLATGEQLILRIPSAIIPHEFHQLINPKHPQFKLLKNFEVRPFKIDPRLGIEMS